MNPLGIPCFGSLQYYAHVVQQDILYLSKNEQIGRKIKRNRYQIMSPNGKQLLTVPILNARDRQVLSAAKIVEDTNWQLDHWRSIQTAYGRSPFFEFYDYKFAPLYEQTFTYLLDFNLAAFSAVLDCLKHPIKIQFNETAEQVKPLTEVQVIPYNQVFEDRHPFDGSLCILDLIFNLGPDAKAYLSRMTEH